MFHDVESHCGYSKWVVVVVDGLSFETPGHLTDQSLVGGDAGGVEMSWGELEVLVLQFRSKGEVERSRSFKTGSTARGCLWLRLLLLLLWMK